MTDTPQDDEKTFKFNWQKEPEGFLKWLIPHVLPKDDPKATMSAVDQLSKATDKFTNVELTMLINGIKVDARRFLTRVEQNMEYYARQEAARMLNEIAGFDEVQERLDTIRMHFISEVESTFRKHGIELPEWND